VSLGDGLGDRPGGGSDASPGTSPGAPADAAAKPFSVLRRPPEGPGYPPVFRLLADDGVYEVRTTPAGQFCAKVEGLTGVREGFYPALPPCPAAILARTVEIFKELPETEAMVTIAFDEVDRCHRLVWQGDRADRASVRYLPLLDNDRHVVVAEIHSHHNMEAYFSPQDDAAERAVRLYGVVGRVGLERPHALFRYACGVLPDGSPRFRYVPAEDLFAPAAEVWSIVRQPAFR
jgi:hypothetical protein